MQNIAEFRIIGRVGKIEAKEKVTYLSVASNSYRKEGDDWVQETSWNNITVFGKTAERVNNAHKGDLVHITGRIRQNSYDQNGTTRYTVDLIADRFAVLSKANGEIAEAKVEDYADTPF